MSTDKIISVAGTRVACANMISALCQIDFNK